MTHLPGYPSSAFTLLAKPTGAACNLACGYCFYLSKEQLYPGRSLRMPDEVLKAYIKQMLTSQQSKEVSISWQGGEPTLMGLDFFKRSIELVRQHKIPGQQVVFSLQTNGTLLNDEWCAFFKKHNFLIGLSMDGPQDMHDAFRLNKGGQGTFEQVRHGWDLLQKHNVDTNILCAVHAANASHPLDVYRFFRDGLQARFIQFVPIVERLTLVTHPQSEKQGQELPGRKLPVDVHKGGCVSQRSVKPDQFGTFLVDVFEEWVHHDVGTVFIQSFDAALASWCHLPASVCIFQEVCGASLVLEHNGDLYSCDHFVEPGYRLGNIMQTPMAELANLSRQRKFGLAKRNRLPDYFQKCDVLFACQGECPRNRFLQTPDGDEGWNYLCPSYKLFFHHIDQPIRIMKELLQRGRAPAAIMQM